MTEPLSIHAGVPPPATKKLITAGASAGNAPSSFSALSGETLTLGSSSYRPDIDGLRAVAILAVVIFHAFPGSLPGGFAGVDIFFVISGFLISRIIFKGMQQGNFSFSLFYAHRIKRILPALILVLAASYSFGWFTLFPDEFKQLSKHIAASLGFVQNFFLWRETGYFNTATELKPLMHLWSLAIEEQFYLVYPLAIWCVWKARVNVLGFVVVLGLLSFNSNLANPAGSFFLPQARFWEIWSGSVLAYVQLFGKRQLMEHLRRWAPSLVSAGTTGLQLDHTVRSSLSVAALLLAAATVFGLDSTKNFPGWWALAPVAAAFLLIAVGPDAWVNRVILANRGMVWVGLVSYPLYLWHWPLLSFLQILEYGHPSLNTRLAAVALSFLLAWLTYRLVETPIRGGSNSRIKVGLLCMFAAAVVYAGCHTFILNGMPSRRVVEINSGISSTLLPAYKDHMDSRCGLNEEAAKKFPQCQSDDRGVAKFALLGDSKAAVLAPGVFQASTSNGYWLFMGGTNREGYALVPVVSDAAQYSPMSVRPQKAIDRSSSLWMISSAAVHAFLAHGAQAVEHGAADVGALGAQGHGLEHVLAGADAAVHVHLDAVPTASTIAAARDGGGRAVELAAAVVGDDQRIGAGFGGERASSTSWMPLRISLPPQRFLIHSTSSQFRRGSNCLAVHSDSEPMFSTPLTWPTMLPKRAAFACPACPGTSAAWSSC
jgi:peptidoglycan/LPS O-acetylase OafA/YrhL